MDSDAEPVRPPSTTQLPVPEFKLHWTGTHWTQKEFGT